MSPQPPLLPHRARFVEASVRLFVYAVLVAVTVGEAVAQGLVGAGSPLTRVYTSQDYDGSAQIFDIAQGARGELYFTDFNLGLHELDGQTWRLHDIPDAMLAVEEDRDGRLWLAGPAAVGYMEADEKGSLRYVSLLDELPPEQRNFSDAWPIYPTSRGVFVAAREVLLRWHEGRFTSWPGSLEEIFYRIYEIDGRLFFAQLGVGLLELVDDELELVSGDLLGGTTEINAMFSRGDGTAWVLTRLHGVFLLGDDGLQPVNVGASQWLIDQQVQHGCKLPQEGFAIASRRGGVALLDSELNLLKVLDESTGLSDGKINYVRLDHQENLWVATDDGISRVILDPSLSLLGPEVGLEGGAHVVTRHQGRLVVGTGLGVYLGEEEADGRLSFSSIPDLPSATWSFISDEDILLAATTDGVFEIRLAARKGLALHLVRRLTVDATQQIFRSEPFPDDVLIALDNGLGRLQKRNGSWSWVGRISGIESRAWGLEQGTDGEILAWLPSSDELAVLRFGEQGLDAPPRVERFAVDAGWTPLRVGDELIRFNGEGHERYVGGSEPGAWPFEPMPELDYLKDPGLVAGHRDPTGRLWVYGPQGLGFADRVDATRARFRPPAARPLDGVLTVYSDPDLADTHWITSKDGIYRWHPDAGRPSRATPRALVRRVSLLKSGDELYGGGGRLDTFPVLPFESGSLRFEFAAPIYDQQSPVSYQVRLDGFDAEWSSGSEEWFKEYTNLREGAYSFRVRAQDAWGEISHEASFGFRVLPPWYRTPWSLAGFFLLAVGLVFLGIQWRTHSHLKERRRLEALVEERTEELVEGKQQVERQASALEAANRQLAEENEHRRVLEAEQEKLHRRIEQSQKLESLGLVAGGVAHDFNNILMAILGNADLALEDGNMDPTALRKRLQEIRRASHRAADLCRQMLAYAGKGPLRKDEVDLSLVARDCIDLLASSVPQGVSIDFDTPSSLPAVSADATQMRQVVMNLVLNATESFDAERLERGGRVSVELKVCRLEPDFFEQTVLADPLPGGSYVQLRVEDDGSGIDPETLRKIFDPFFTSKFTGRGLGLATVLGIVRSHDGAVRVSSEPGLGTTMDVFLPALDHEADASTSSSEQDLRSWHRSGTVLVIDDEEIVRNVVTVMLRNTGFDVLAAAEGDEGIDLFRHHRHSIVATIVDLNLPGSNGRQILTELLEIDPQAKVILSTGYSGDRITERYLEEGFAGLLRKPYRSNTLRELLHQVLGE